MFKVGDIVIVTDDYNLYKHPGSGKAEELTKGDRHMVIAVNPTSSGFIKIDGTYSSIWWRSERFVLEQNYNGPKRVSSTNPFFN